MPFGEHRKSHFSSNLSTLIALTPLQVDRLKITRKKRANDRSESRSLRETRNGESWSFDDRRWSTLAAIICNHWWRPISNRSFHRFHPFDVPNSQFYASNVGFVIVACFNSTLNFDLQNRRQIKFSFIDYQSVDYRTVSRYLRGNLLSILISTLI